MTPLIIDNIHNRLGFHEGRLDGHDSDIKGIKDQAREDRSDVRGLRNLIIGALVSALGGAILQVIVLLAKALKG